MIFVTGPLFAGKQACICSLLGRQESEFHTFGVRDVQDLAAEAEDLAALAETLSAYAVVIATEVGGGVVPMDAHQRYSREQAGRLACLLAQKADTVIRVCCGIPQVLKGTLPC